MLVISVFRTQGVRGQRSLDEPGIIDGLVLTFATAGAETNPAMPSLQTAKFSQRIIQFLGRPYCRPTCVHVHTERHLQMTSKRIAFNAFDMTCIMHQSPGLWAHPKDRSTDYKKLSYWIDLARLLERGKFESLSIADVLGVYDTYQGSPDASIRSACGFLCTTR
jgi:hypothetical protein